MSCSQRARQRPLHAVQLPSGPPLLDALRGALEGAGPALLPLSPDLPEPRRRELLTELRPHALVTPEGMYGLRDGVDVAEGAALVMATSGSTGRPKGVELSSTAVTHSAKATLARLEARPGDRWLASLPPAHVAGLQVLVRCVVSGAEPIYPPDRSGTFDAEATVASGAEYVSLVPTMLRRLLDAGADVARFRTILLGGAASSPGLLTRAARAGANVVTTYGMTETCGGCVYDGVPLAGVEADFADDGRIRLAGPTLFTGYRLRPDLTARARHEGWLTTQDLGRWEGGRLRVLGRVDDVIITGGHNVVPDEVASLLAGHPRIADVAVIGRPDPEWGQRVAAVAVPVDPLDPPSLREVRAYVRKRAAAHLAPHELDVVPALPLLESGKPDREALRQGRSRQATAGGWPRASDGAQRRPADETQS